MGDPETLAVYGAQARRYAEISSVSPRLASFLGHLAPGSRVLDLGCGPGQDAAAMAAVGIRAEAWDACPEMVALATERPGVAARRAQFEDLTEIARYDAIWASFSLLHVPRDDLPDLLRRMHRALVPRGLIHIGVKTGVGFGRDCLGRFYTYWSETDLCDLLRRADFTVMDIHHGEGVGLAGQLDPFVEIRAHG